MHCCIYFPCSVLSNDGAVEAIRWRWGYHTAPPSPDDSPGVVSNAVGVGEDAKFKMIEGEVMYINRSWSRRGTKKMETKY